MLTQIYLRNFLLIKKLDLDWATGFTVLTGETGAGKSILIDAINLALGARADTQFIKKGTDRCTIILTVNIDDNTEAKAWLKKNDCESDECVIKRILFKNGHSKSSVNGYPFNQTMLRQFSQHLLHIHAQHHSQLLLKPEQQLKLLDNFANNQELLAQTQVLYQQWHSQQTQLEQRIASTENRERELEFLRFQYDEINHAQIKKDEWLSLSEKHQQLHHGKALLDNLDDALNATTDGEPLNALLLLEQALQFVQEIKIEQPQIINIKELLNNAVIYLREAGSELQNLRNHLEYSGDSLPSIEARMSLLHDLARKHRTDPTALLEIERSLATRIHDLENIENKIEKIKQKQQHIINQYNLIASQLTQSRQKAAIILDKKITTIINQLGIQGGKLQICCESHSKKITPTGAESCCFTIRTNVGSEFQPLQKVVSGGELSRISLALQSMIAEKDIIPTLIFDEIDGGLGGETAEVVGSLLKKLSKCRQVFCVTHLAQVASKANHHFKIEKHHHKDTTETTVVPLSPQQRIHEIARMASGTQITAETLTHAEILLANS